MRFLVLNTMEIKIKRSEYKDCKQCGSNLGFFKEKIHKSFEAGIRAEKERIIEIIQEVSYICTKEGKGIIQIFKELLSQINSPQPKQDVTNLSVSHDNRETTRSVRPDNFDDTSSSSALTNPVLRKNDTVSRIDEQNDEEVKE